MARTSGEESYLKCIITVLHSRTSVTERSTVWVSRCLKTEGSEYQRIFRRKKQNKTEPNIDEVTVTQCKWILKRKIKKQTEMHGKNKNQYAFMRSICVIIHCCTSRYNPVTFTIILMTMTAKWACHFSHFLTNWKKHNKDKLLKCPFSNKSKRNKTKLNY